MVIYAAVEPNCHFSRSMKLCMAIMVVFHLTYVDMCYFRNHLDGKMY
jgi:hypothetical protein